MLQCNINLARITQPRGGFMFCVIFMLLAMEFFKEKQSCTKPTR